jgi:hypothetical protein
MQQRLPSSDEHFGLAAAVNVVFGARVDVQASAGLLPSLALLIVHIGQTHPGVEAWRSAGDRPGDA